MTKLLQNDPVMDNVELHECSNGGGYILIWRRHFPLTKKQYGHEYHATIESAQVSIREILRYAEERLVAEKR